MTTHRDHAQLPCLRTPSSALPHNNIVPMVSRGDMPAPIVEVMRTSPPWESPVYRNRHGRGIRTPMFGARLPRYRTRSGMFDDMTAAQIRRLHDAWPNLVADIQFAVEDVPPSAPAPWEDQPDPLSQGFAAGRGIPARIVLYRLPIQTRCRTRMELQLAIRDELVSRLANLSGRRPEEIDPDWGL